MVPRHRNPSDLLPDPDIRSGSGDPSDPGEVRHSPSHRQDPVGPDPRPLPLEGERTTAEGLEAPPAESTDRVGATPAQAGTAVPTSTAPEVEPGHRRRSGGSDPFAAPSAAQDASAREETDQPETELGLPDDPVADERPTPPAPDAGVTRWPSGKPVPKYGEPGFDTFAVYVDATTGELLSQFNRSA